MDKVKVAKELLKLAKMLSAADEKEELTKKFEKLTLGGRDADEIAKNAKEYQELCEEWAKEFPDELPPVPGKIDLK
jgi:hypothetical protein